MKVDFCDNTGSLWLQVLGRNGNRVTIGINVSLFKEETETDIRFETETYINIDEWQQKRETLASQNTWELENISAQAKHNISDTVYQEYFLYEYLFVIRSNINNGCLTFTMKSEMSFEDMLEEEISKYMQSPSEDAESSSRIDDELIHVTLKETWKEGNLRGRMVKVDSCSFHIVSNYIEPIYPKHPDYVRIRDFNEGQSDTLFIGSEQVDVKFKWIDGIVTAAGTIDDYMYPRNSLEFKGPAKITWLEE